MFRTVSLACAAACWRRASYRRCEAIGVHRGCMDGFCPSQDVLGEYEGHRRCGEESTQGQGPPQTGALFWRRPSGRPLDRWSTLERYNIRVSCMRIVKDNFIVNLFLCFARKLMFLLCGRFNIILKFSSRRLQPPRKIYGGVRKSTWSLLTQHLGPLRRCWRKYSLEAIIKLLFISLYHDKCLLFMLELY